MIAFEFSFCQLSALPPNLRPTFLGDDHWAHLGTPPPHPTPGSPSSLAHSVASPPMPTKLARHPASPRVFPGSRGPASGGVLARPCGALGNHLPSVPQFPPLWEEGLAVNGLESGEEDTIRLASQGREED